MRFGKINYLNLAPFDVFIKSYPATSGFKKFLQLHQSYPAQLNHDFFFQRIDAGFISSIAGYYSFIKSKNLLSGIIAKKSVWSVIVIQAEQKKDDYQSATSNALCRVLDLKGEVLIGDRALQYRYANKPHLDMGQIWFEKQNLPFVFGLLCCNKYQSLYKKISIHFNQKRIKIPQYILEEYVSNLKISKKYILEYLTHIYYRIGPKELLGLKRFYRQLLLKQIKKPMRFASQNLQTSIHNTKLKKQSNKSNNAHYNNHSVPGY